VHIKTLGSKLLILRNVPNTQLPTTKLRNKVVQGFKTYLMIKSLSMVVIERGYQMGSKRKLAIKGLKWCSGKTFVVEAIWRRVITVFLLKLIIQIKVWPE